MYKIKYVYWKKDRVMKRFVVTLIMVVAASSSLAGEITAKQTPVAASKEETSKRPLLDQIKTYSIRRDTDAVRPEPRVRSGIEVNPWIVPSFN